MSLIKKAVVLLSLASTLAIPSVFGYSCSDKITTSFCTISNQTGGSLKLSHYKQECVHDGKYIIPTVVAPGSSVKVCFHPDDGGQCGGVNGLHWLEVAVKSKAGGTDPLAILRCHHHTKDNTTDDALQPKGRELKYSIKYDSENVKYVVDWGT